MTNLHEIIKTKRGNRFRHGLSGTRIHSIWRGMLKRCLNPNAGKYKNYGGRGITVCERWMVFENFYSDMSDSYKDGLTLDRVDNNGNYEAINCRWSTCKEQNRNRRSSKLITFNGETKTLAEWSESTGIGIGAIQRRMKLGWTIEDTFTIPPKVGRNQFSKF